MKRFAVIGDPIDHSLSPILHNWVYKQLGIEAVYEKINVKSAKVSTFVNSIRNGDFNGINVTSPHKMKIVDYVDEINPRAKIIGSVNFLINHNNKIIGNNTDWYGFILALRKNKISLNDREVIVIGSGGVTKSVIFALKHLGARKINLFNRSYNKIKDFKTNKISPHRLKNLSSFIKESSIIINCTTIGMLSNQSPLDSSLLTSSQIVIDSIYNPLSTKLILDAKKNNAITVSGLDMFIFQALASIDLWFGEGTTNKVNFEELKGHIEMHLC